MRDLCFLLSLAFTPLIVAYTIEIVPYNIRAKALTVFNFTISLALIFNQYVNPIALDALGWKYYVVYCCWILVEFVFCYLYVVETKGHSLEETAALFDGKDAVEQVAGAATDLHEDVFIDEKDSGASYHTPTIPEKTV